MEFTFGKTKVTINMPTRTALEDEVRRRFRAGQGFALATINLDHLSKMSVSPDFAKAYSLQDLVVADGWPVGRLSGLSGHPIQVMPGSDLVEPLCQIAADEKVKLALVGSTEVALDDARRILTERVPGLEIALTISPSGQFDPNGAEALDILNQIKAQDIGFCFLALGAPKQEELALRGRAVTPKTGFASVGAGLDFLGGHQIRAPLWMRRVGLEWFWRTLLDPVRMVPRYVRCFAILPRETLNALRQRRANS
ncbi:WecB/TagA/CpsF family glycosyltransferase [Phaeobacter marinintestinus]|uniref:WecB/TagA/CpsF family glycosyltransferase n=1 Tax=Falsiphaeobacter marinintestinus TaxID=1492905 RepID=UPI001FE8F082|nr:WecB/TagA/CpsF family glycosyltransferase [Phaeobacter marinintestinus]